MTTNWPQLGDACGLCLKGGTAVAQTGGSISNVWKVNSDQGWVLVKLEACQEADRLLAEVDGLKALSAAKSLRVPQVIATAATETTACLVLEWIEPGYASIAAERLGEGLAKQHRLCGEAFGWRRDNYIGSTPQPNNNCENWPAFLREQRLGFQCTLATENNYHLDELRVRRLLESLEFFYSDYQPSASLLHGDLWSGNWFSDQQGRPVIIDPAVYYGDREADLAMSELFGGFGPDFYAGYDSGWSLDPGYSVRRDLHQLYHVLNHLNLFGGAYFDHASTLLDRLCSELA